MKGTDYAFQFCYFQEIDLVVLDPLVLDLANRYRHEMLALPEDQSNKAM